MSSFPNRTILLALILVLGFTVRFLPYVNNLQDYPAPLSTPDPHYHARRVLITVNNFPNHPVFDYYISYPTGGYCIWPPLFDFLCATIAYTIFLGHPTVPQVEWTCAVYPIFYALFVIFMTYLIGKEIFDEGTGILSALVTALLPGTLYWSRLGYNDHHIAESLAILMILYFLLHNQNRIRDWIYLGIVFGIGLLLWQGSILFIGISFVILIVLRKPLSLISFFISFLIILPFSINTHFPDSPFSYRGLSLLHLSLLVGAALFMFVLFLIQRKKYPFALIPLAFLLYFVISLLRTEGFIGGLSFIIKHDPWLATIIEFKPLMVRPGYIITFTAKHLYGLVYYVWPLALIIMILENHQKKHIIYAIFLIFTGIMAFLGRRYSVWFTPLFAILSVYAFLKVFDVLKKIFAQRTLPALGLVVLLLLISSIPVYIGYIGFSGAPMKKELKCYKWIADSTPPTSYYLEPDKKPEYGIMCFWSDGHELMYYSHRPVAASNFGNDVPNFKLATRFYITESESSATAILNKLNCRYILFRSWLYYLRYAALYTEVDPEHYLEYYPVKDREGLISTIIVPNTRGKLTTISRLQYYTGSGIYLDNKFYPPYHRYRLRYVSDDERIKVYELVKGAVISGQANPNTPVKLNLKLEVHGYKFEYFDSLNTDKNGLFSFVVPYPADSANPYTIQLGNKKLECVLPERYVLEGDTLLLK
ncbi:hypothetical protein BXT86_01830 [candidate division WOR-3 bacterium 4484_100]|uniref:Uncharacterized protein n=1 Tax=candidate division WOR-3 bacterium 4484_100 TaxID=1936077 RepID=A0A1V4QH31_UNCW3|nr:MAG: hypothetical protein BXT86_01830 [candidate division WOR-3 bacterium 4484_100]